jgi:hypothetical protein
MLSNSIDWMLIMTPFWSGDYCLPLLFFYLLTGFVYHLFSSALRRHYLDLN